jgi:hypothetical protein
MVLRTPRRVADGRVIGASRIASTVNDCCRPNRPQPDEPDFNRQWRIYAKPLLVQCRWLAPCRPRPAPSMRVNDGNPPWQSCNVSLMGHSRRFNDVRVMSVYPPIATLYRT